MEPLAQLREGCKALGLCLEEAQLARLLGYCALLAKWNKAYALTTITEPGEMVTHHLLDSLSIAHLVGSAPGSTVLDVGSGGGTPGIPLAIACPEKHFTLLDSNQKKTTFLNQAKIELGLSNVTVVAARVEAFQGQFDVITSRAFASLADFWQGANAHLRPEGCFLAMKGVYPAEEIAALPAACRVESVLPLLVPGVMGKRHVVSMRHCPAGSPLPQEPYPAWFSIILPEVRARLQQLGTPLLWRSVQALHGNPPRHYHTWQHIEACLHAAQEETFEDPLAVTLAILFHDCIYVAGAKNNETQSAALCADMPWSSAPADASSFARAREMILATTNHAALPADASPDLRLMVDIDLGILATPPEVYDRYTNNVRREWVPSVVSDAQFRAGRAAFLQGMLAAEHIFHSARYASREATARANLRRELERLQAGASGES